MGCRLGAGRCDSYRSHRRDKTLDKNNVRDPWLGSQFEGTLYPEGTVTAEGGSGSHCIQSGGRGRCTLLLSSEPLAHRVMLLAFRMGPPVSVTAV